MTLFAFIYLVGALVSMGCVVYCLKTQMMVLTFLPKFALIIIAFCAAVTIALSWVGVGVTYLTFYTNND
jgi:hypothetical protein